MRVGRRPQTIVPWWECFSVERTAVTPTAGAWLANNLVNVTVPGPTTLEEVLQTLCASAQRPIPIPQCRALRLIVGNTNIATDASRQAILKAIAQARLW